ncbi:hypothetical protein P3T43_006907 [Paraburkholderia sp. GAS41]|uniref:hypothetical protein n=1 Tax=Paraburkholderia sp. GAS41 TaxID=3035134 RepID=UPI003D22F823
MKNKDDKQASFDFNRHSALSIETQKPTLKSSASVIRVVFSNNSQADSSDSVQDVDAINRRILDLVK